MEEWALGHGTPGQLNLGRSSGSFALLLPTAMLLLLLRLLLFLLLLLLLLLLQLLLLLLLLLDAAAISVVAAITGAARHSCSCVPHMFCVDQSSGML